MGLDQFSQGVSASQHHPRGEFLATIREVKVEEKKDKSGKMFLFDLKTDKGFPPTIRISWVTEDDYSRGESLQKQGDTEPLKKVETSIRMLKQALIKLSVFDEKTINGMTYSACIKTLGTLKGKPCRVQVKEQKNNPQYDQTDFLYMPREEAKQFSQEQAATTVSPGPSNGFSIDDLPF